MNMDDEPEDSLSSSRYRLEGFADLHEDLERLRRKVEELEPTVQCLLPEENRFSRLHRDADAAQAAHPKHIFRPSVFGHLIGVKDIFHVDGFPTRAGSKLPPEVLAGPQAEVVTQLRKDGALLLGKTVSTEFAYYAPGPTRNPHNPEHTPGGSSSGSAAAVASGFCPVALGTQTIGSIIRPAAYCGVIGFKPSYGLISTAGVIPLAPSVDHVGLFAVDMASAHTVALALFPGFPSSSESIFRRPVLGIPEGPYLSKASDEGLAHFRDTCDWLTSRYKVKTVPALADFDDIETRHRRLVAAEAAQVHEDWFRQYRDLYAPQTVELIEKGQKVSSRQLNKDRKGCAQLRDELEDLMEKHGIDLWLSPPAQGPAPAGIGNTGNPVMNLPWTHAGLPTLGLPAGVNADGMPMGLQVTGIFRGDEDLLHWGYELARVLAL